MTWGALPNHLLGDSETMGWRITVLFGSFCALINFIVAFKKQFHSYSPPLGTFFYEVVDLSHYCFSFECGIEAQKTWEFDIQSIDFGIVDTEKFKNWKFCWIVYLHQIWIGKHGSKFEASITNSWKLYHLENSLHNQQNFQMCLILRKFTFMKVFRYILRIFANFRMFGIFLISLEILVLLKD